MNTISINLTDDLIRFVDQAARASGFANGSDYVVSLIAADYSRHKELEAWLIEGLESGPAEELTPEAWANIRQEVAERLSNRQ